MADEKVRRGVKAATRQRKAYRLGIKTRRDATRTRERLQLLHRTMSLAEIADASGIYTTTLWKILHGQKTVLPRTEAKVLAVAPSNGLTLVNSLGTQRRIQALTAMGWTGGEIGRQVGARRGDAWANVTRMMQEKSITARLAADVAAVYEELRYKTPPESTATRRAKARAQRKQWAPPPAWDDVDIDDPAAEPDWSAVRCETECGRPVQPGRFLCATCLAWKKKHGTLDGYTPARHGRELAEDALWISKLESWSLREGKARALVAERLGVTVTALEKSLERYGDAIMQAFPLVGKER